MIEANLMEFPSEAVKPELRSDPSDLETLPANRPAPRILIVDDEPAQRKLLAVMLEQGGVACKAVAGAEEALHILPIERVDAVIADLNMPEVSGMDLLREIRLRFPHLVFLMATGIEDVRMGVQAMRKGADDYLIKPLQLDSVLMSLERAFLKKQIERELEDYRKNLEAMVCKRTVQLQNALGKLEQSYAGTLDALGAAIDLRDGQTAGHSRRVALYSIQLWARLNGTPGQQRTLVMGAWLHDIGKLAIPDAILLKPDALTKEEWIIMQGHVQIGYDLVKRIPFLADAAEIIHAHHEHWNGNGYPRGLKGTEIPFVARIFAVADTLDAMTSDRPYRRAIGFPEARSRIGCMAGKQLDPDLVKTFLSIPGDSWKALREQSSTMKIDAALSGIFTDDPTASANLVAVHAG